MIKRLIAIVAVAGFASAYTSQIASAAYTRAAVVLRFSTMYAVDGPFVGEDNPIRNLPGDGLPWAIRSAEGTLLSDGTLTLTVRGLVFTQDDEVPPELRGINDEDHFRGIVSCLTEEGDKVSVSNVATNGFAASRTGDAYISQHLKLPNPCVAPIVFVAAGDEDDWLAVTGVEN
jgi:hypothetical protein